MKLIHTFVSFQIDLVTEWVYPGTKLDPVFGDRIEMSRWIGVYKHWALYLGNDIVVNFTGADNPASKSKSDKVKILQSNLYETIGQSPARINNELDAMYFRPTTRADVTRRIQYFMDTWPEYSVVSNNCEHFTNYCRYEKRISKQVNPAVGYNPVQHGFVSPAGIALGDGRDRTGGGIGQREGFSVGLGDGRGGMGLHFSYGFKF